MAKVFIEESTLTSIGNAIRNKTGKTDLIDPAVMDVEIESIVSGGGELPEEAFKVTGNCQYRFASNGWNWYIDEFGNRVTTENINNASYLCWYSDTLTQIPFTINVNNTDKLNAMFVDCMKLTKCPKVRGTLNWTSYSGVDCGSMIKNCRSLKDVEDLFEPSMLDGYSNFKVTSAYSCPKIAMFSGCYSLRKIPAWFYKFRLNETSTAYPASSADYCLYTYAIQDCYTLDEFTNVPVWKCAAAQTSNMFQYTFNYATRLKNFTFEVQADGTPYETSWKSQVIDLSTYTGYTLSVANLTSYNSGITKDKEVKNITAYEALKDDPDWFTQDFAFSRYNHDSAVATINSLPDTSAYLATAGGTNTIKFKGLAGNATDGGAINTLTEEEIAVATAKGWTVTLV